MIHTITSRYVSEAFGLIAITALLAGCAGSSASYPSFAIPKTASEDGRVSARFEHVPAYDLPDAEAGTEPLPVELDARLAAINTRALNASTAFTSQTASTRRLTQAAQSADITSNEWVAAQIGLASLSSHHSNGRLALADLDLLAAKADITLADRETLAEIAQLQAELAATLDEQLRILDTMTAKLER